MARVGSHPWDGPKKPRGAVSTDGGTTWTQFGSEPAHSNGSGSLAVSADGSVMLWAPQDARGSISGDRGSTWICLTR
jgi:hypothetical protein